MSDTFDDFVHRINVHADNVPREVGKVVRLTALAVDQTVVMATPVDTGRARSNWIVSVDKPVDAVIEPYVALPKGKGAGKLGETGNAQAAMNQGQEVIATREPEQSICITNNVEYITALNDGSSAQAPALFIESAVDAGVAAVNGAKIDTR
jgi:hypothetical protein